MRNAQEQSLHGPRHGALGFLLALLVAVSSTACIALKGDQLPVLSSESLAQPDRAIHLTFDAQYSGNGELRSDFTEKYVAVVQAALEESGYFASEMGADVHLSLNLDEQFDEGKAYLVGFLSGLTLLVFPAIASADLVLDADLYQGGVKQASFEYEDSTTFVMQILLLPLTPFFWPGRVSEEILQNEVLHVVAAVAGRE